MKNTLMAILVAMMTGCTICSSQTNERVKIILDTDVMTDYDDVGAIAMLHAMADKGECDILATISCTRGNHSVGVLEVINKFYGRADIPVACTKGTIGVRGRPNDHKRIYGGLLSRFKGWYKYENSSNAPDAVELYRKTLAAADDDSVVICSIGFLTNIRNLLESKPDAYSSLDGKQLVAKKVKMWYAMACEYPRGKEYNTKGDAESSKIALRDFPKPIVFGDWQLGFDVYSGRGVTEKGYVNNPVADVFARELPPRDVCIEQNKKLKKGQLVWTHEEGHCSWDQTVVLAAVRGLGEYYNCERGTYVMIGNDGTNEWKADEKSQNIRLTEKMPKKELGKVMDDLIAAPPKFK